MINVKQGERYGRLTVIKEMARTYQPSGQFQRVFLCKCDCGNEKSIRLSHLRFDRVRSCGCMTGEQHRDSKSSIYNKWRGIKNRCYAESYSEYRYYGGKGIKMCDEWKNSYLKFKEWVIQNGYEPGLQIDRINSDLDYCPENCRLVTPAENSLNKSNTLIVNYNGIEKPLLSILRELGKEEAYARAAERIRKGWDVKRAIEKPVHQGNYKRKIKL